MVILTPAVLSVSYTCVLYFRICTCSAQLSMFHMKRHSRNTLIIIIIISFHFLFHIPVALTEGVISTSIIVYSLVMTVNHQDLLACQCYSF